MSDMTATKVLRIIICAGAWAAVFLCIMLVDSNIDALSKHYSGDGWPAFVERGVVGLVLWKALWSWASRPNTDSMP